MNDRAVNTPARATSYDEFVRDALSMIPAYAPAWTNYNPSDPGITLIELLAYISEALVYRAQRISPDAKLNFLRVLRGLDWPEWKQLLGRPTADIDSAIRRHVESLTATRSAVTAQDFEELAVEIAMKQLGPSHFVQAKSLVSADGLAMLRGRVAEEIAPGDMLVVLAPEPALPVNRVKQLRRHVRDQLEPLCLLTSHVHVVAPDYIDITVGCQLVPYPRIPPAAALSAANESLRRRFGPPRAEDPPGVQHRFGQPVYLSDIAAMIDGAQGVDYAENIAVRRIVLLGDYFAADANPEVGIRIGRYSKINENTRLGGSASIGYARLTRDRTGEAVAINLRPWELARVRVENDVH